MISRVLFCCLLFCMGCDNSSASCALRDEIQPPDLMQRVVERYDSGARRGEGAHTGKEKVGLWLYWYESGRLQSKGIYEKGQQSGLWVTWAPLQGIATGGSFYDGKRYGPWIEFLDGGQIVWSTSGYYEADVRKRELDESETEAILQQLRSEDLVYVGHL